MKKIYKDVNGIKYEVGDIVVNPFFGDMWLVEAYTKEEMKQYDTNCPLCLSQYGCKDNYFMDIDEPMGFRILCKVGQDGYDVYYKNMKQISDEIQEEERRYAEEIEEGK